MTHILITLSLAILITDGIRLSMMSLRAQIMAVILWASAAFVMTLWLTDISSARILEFFSLQDVCTYGILEDFIFLSFIFYERRGKGILAVYPGLLLFAPVTFTAYGLSRSAGGMSFGVVAALAALTILSVLSVVILIFRHLKADKTWLYLSSLISLTIYILLFEIS